MGQPLRWIPLLPSLIAHDHIYNYLWTRNNTKTVRCRWFESLGKVHTKRMPWAYRVPRIQPKYIGLWRARDCLCDLEPSQPEYTTSIAGEQMGWEKAHKWVPHIGFSHDPSLSSTTIINLYKNQKIPIPSQALFPPQTSLQISLVRTPSGLR